VLRYPKGMTKITGYEFEPRHYRYVGVPLATEMHTTGIKTLEQFFDLSAAPDYAGGAGRASLDGIVLCA
jgi:D-alanyl-D-alanine carboxypeptidase